MPIKTVIYGSLNGWMSRYRGKKKPTCENEIDKIKQEPTCPPHTAAATTPQDTGTTPLPSTSRKSASERKLEVNVSLPDEERSSYVLIDEASLLDFMNSFAACPTCNRD